LTLTLRIHAGEIPAKSLPRRQQMQQSRFTPLQSACG
jgi:hypothetical protein